MVAVGRDVAEVGQVRRLSVDDRMGRLLDKIVSVAVKGPSSGGKSHLVKQVMGFFPQSASSPRFPSSVFHVLPARLRFL